jgi:hypothetical protein
MTIEGHTDYKRREYCNDIECQVQLLLNAQDEGSTHYEEIRQLCKTNCIHTTYDFHHWLIDRGFLIVKPDKSEILKGGT